MGTTIKKTVIQSFAATTRASGMEQAGVILVTAMGAICGKPVLPTDPKDKSNACIIALDVAKDNFSEIEDIGNDGFITLTDATIRTQSGTKFNFNTISVFFDQIIAVSIGTLEN